MAERLTLDRIISEITQNSLDANCTEIKIFLNKTKYRINLLILDNGNIKGEIDKFTNKGYSSKKSSGLGLYMIMKHCLNHFGDLKITRSNHTQVELSYDYDRTDENLFQGLDEVLYLLSINDIDIVFEYICNDYKFEYSTLKIKEILDGVSIKEIKVMNMIKEIIRDGLNNV